ncbi:hypothetical protein LTR08_000990 [Meristemomyces frigidus]|nr:hypothetical protein LTR08_000990 [Meristemomyces frigidus]
MSLTVEKLNDDTTFLLAFAPSFAPSKPPSRRLPGAFTILLDPWLAGRASILHPAFQTSSHARASAIPTLTALPDPPDLIIISQSKPDHCHRATLCTLPPATPTRILATPAAAKKIRSWQHFDAAVVHVLPPYHPRKPATVTRIALPAYTAASAAGELTIAHIPTKRDLTGLHNAIAITYRAPASLLTSFEDEPPKPRPATNPLNTTTPSPPPRPIFLDPLGLTLPPLPPPKTEKVLSTLYTPHGLSPSTLHPYLTTHLTPTTAPAPLTLLLHGLHTASNPRLLGGRVARGAPGGVPIAKMLRARYWVGAHDGGKVEGGVAVRGAGGGGGGGSEVCVLGVGEGRRFEG